MDKTTHEIRLANWKSVIKACQARPVGQTAREWLTVNNISEKQYYYWLRQIRREVIEESKTSLPKAGATELVPGLTFAEFPAEDILSDDAPSAPTIIIRTKESTIELYATVTDSLVLSLAKAVSHAV